MHPRLTLLLLALLLGPAPFSLSAQPVTSRVPPTPRPRDQTRQPWSRGDERFLRRWIVSREFDAPVADSEAFTRDLLADAGGEAAIRPTAPPAAAPRPPGSPPPMWRAVTAWGDSVDLADGTNLKRHLIGYAFTTVTRPVAGKARLCIGSDESIRVWLNGALVLERRGPRPLTYDEDQLEVDLNAGENTLLVKVEQRSGPWTFAARILESGAIPPRMQEIGPSLIEESPAALLVKTDINSEHAGEVPVLVQAVGAGGKILAEKTVLRGATVRLDPTTWPAGAYEIRCETRKLNGARCGTHLPWFKGDALAAGRALMAAAAAADGNTPAGAQLKMLASMVPDRLGEKMDALSGDVWWAIHSPLLEFEELQLEAAGDAAARKRPYGFFRTAYRDEIDGSIQYCRFYLPPGYTPEKKWPVVIRLHGLNPPNPPYIRWWSAAVRHTFADTEYGARNEGVIYIEPHGRGNTTYLGLGDEDIVRTVKHAQELFSVDADRVYLMGDSMGGFGTWNVGTRHPELFAALLPIYGSIEFRALATDEQLAALSPLDRFLQEKRSSWAQGESLLHMPIFVVHGDVDATVSVERSRYGVRQLQRWGYDVRYFEMPGYGHEELQQWDKMFGWLLEQRRVAHPPRVRVRSAELQYASAYWATIEQGERPDRFMVLDAEVVGKNTIRIDTQNVLALALSPGAALVDLAQPVTLVWNGQRHTATATNGRLNLRAENYDATAALQKSTRVAGPLGEILNTPFAIVVGTSAADPAMNRVCRAKADELVAMWRTWQHHTPRLFTDTELTDADAARFSLILIGGANANLVARKLVDRKLSGALPLELPAESGSVKVGARVFQGTGPDVRVLAIAPNPLNPERYALVVNGTSAAAMEGWFPQMLRNADFDFIVEEGNVIRPREVPTSTYRAIARGWFNHRWQVDDTMVFPAPPR